MHRIPYNQKMVIYAPQKVIVHSISSISPSNTHVELILYDVHEFYDTPSSLPSSITHFSVKQNTENESLPSDLPRLHIAKLPSSFPPSLTCLSFAPYFNEPIHDVKLPLSLTHLEFGKMFNQSIDNLPLGLIFLTLGEYFNQPVDKLPLSLTHLSLGEYFNQPVHNLPLSLTHLLLGEYFNQPVDKLPLFLTSLTVGNHFNQSIDKLPPSCKYFQRKGVIPIFDDTFFLKNLPPTLIQLTTGDEFNLPLTELPSTLTHLTTGRDFNQPINSLPPSLSLILHLVILSINQLMNFHSISLTLSLVHSLTFLLIRFLQISPTSH